MSGNLTADLQWASTSVAFYFGPVNVAFGVSYDTPFTQVLSSTPTVQGAYSFKINFQATSTSSFPPPLGHFDVEGSFYKCNPAITVIQPIEFFVAPGLLHPTSF